MLKLKFILIALIGLTSINSTKSEITNLHMASAVIAAAGAGYLVDRQISKDPHAHPVIKILDIGSYVIQFPFNFYDKHKNGVHTFAATLAVGLYGTKVLNNPQQTLGVVNLKGNALFSFMGDWLAKQK